MDELPESARDVLAQLKSAHDPDDPESAARVRRRVAAAVAAVATAGAVSQASASSSLLGAGAKGVMVRIAGHKLLAAVGVVTLGAATAVVAPRWSEPERVRAPEHGLARPPEAEAVRAPEAQAVRAPEPAREAALEAAPTHEVSTPEPGHTRAGPRVERGVPTHDDALVAELALLRRVDRALLADQPAQALALLDEHTRRHPSAELRLERAGLRVIARCALGADGARADADVFLREHPQAVLSARVELSCAK